MKVNSRYALAADSQNDREDGWYKPTIEREVLLSLMQRTNKRASLDVILWLALLGASAWWLIETWLSPISIVAAFVYGTLYGSASDARWHECGHRTAFASKRANDVIYHIASFMDMREPVSWRWSHARHHTETIMVGRDPEIAFPRPMPRWRIVAELFGVLSAGAEWKKYLGAFIGRLPKDVLTYVPSRDIPRVIFWSRIHVLTHTGVLVSCVVSRSVLPAMLIGLPTLYGRWLLFTLGATQHAGLDEDVLDHRLNTRSVRMNPVIRFLYLNMNHHLEHHLFPSVPYHRLPKLSNELESQLPEPSPSLFFALRDVRRRLQMIRIESA